MDDQDQDAGTGSGIGTDSDAPTDQSVISFRPFFQPQAMTNWSWIAVAVMIGNYCRTGPLLPNGNTSDWTQEDVIKRVLGSTQNVSKAAERAMRVTLVFSALNSGNESLANSLSTMRAQIRDKAPVVVGWGTLANGELLNGKYIVVYGYQGSNWYYADPSQANVTQNAPLPVPSGAASKVIYSRSPKIKMR